MGSSIGLDHATSNEDRNKHASELKAQIHASKDTVTRGHPEGTVSLSQPIEPSLPPAYAGR